MTGLVRRAALLAVGGLVVAGAAMAGLPNAANSTLPALITLADGNNPTAVAAAPSCYGNTCIIRDENNLPVPNVTVTLDFSTCTADQHDVGLTQETGVTVNAPVKRVSKDANSSGSVTFSLIGTGNGPSLIPPSCVQVYAGSTLMGTIPVRNRRYDLDASGAVGGFDGTLWLNRFFAGAGVTDAWADYDCTGVPLGGFDGTLWLNAFFAAIPVVVLNAGTW